jgi:ABC-type phosphate transport system substrate-binding protein
MKNLSISLFLFLISATCHAEVVVIVHPDNTSTVSAEDIQAIYLAKATTFANGETAIPINLPASNDVRTIFERDIIQRSKSQMKSYWSKLVFTGQASYPKEVSNSAEVVKLVASNANLIGFVDSASVNESVKIVLRR